MSPVQTVGQVFDSIQHVKAGASAFCTNFFPVQAKVQAWIDHGELFSQMTDRAAFFVRTDRDFGHLYFCAADAPSLQSGLTAMNGLQNRRLTSDIVGQEAALDPLLGPVEAAGFRRYSRLVRLARPNPPGSSAPAGPGAESSQINLAETSDASAILNLLEVSFDPLADQLPTLYE